MEKKCVYISKSSHIKLKLLSIHESKSCNKLLDEFISQTINEDGTRKL